MKTIKLTIMKQKYYSFGALIMMMSALLFSSCMNEDTRQSMALSGEWRGDFGMFYKYEDRRGNLYTFDSYDTYLTFIPAFKYATYGTGTQVDYYEYGPYEYQYYSFKWSIRDGIVYLNYPYDPELNTTIRDYRMTDDYFSGYCDGASTPFRLYKIVFYYDWSRYNSNYGYRNRDNWEYYYPRYAPSTRSASEAPTDSLAADGAVLERGRRVEYQ